MKILLDECVTRKARRFLTEYEVWTVSDKGFNGLKNGKLMRAAEQDGFDILLTIDKNIDYQQNISRFSLTIVVLDVFKSNLRYIEALIPQFKERINQFEKGKSYKISN